MLLTDRYADRIAFTLSCFDRMVFMGTLPALCHPDAAVRELQRRHLRVFDFPAFAKDLADQIRAHAAALAAQHGVAIEFLRHATVRKEALIQRRLTARGTAPGLVHIFSVMERCTAFRPWREKTSGRCTLRATSGKCLHYYFYFLDPAFGLGYLRVPTWAPYRLQVYCNGHGWLACPLAKRGIGFTRADNVFLAIDDPQQAQQLADRFAPNTLHRWLDRLVRTYCPCSPRRFPPATTGA